MKRLLAVALLALLAAATPALADPLTVHVGETWLFTLDHGQPANARKAGATATPAHGEIKISVQSLFGTMMTITNSSAQGYTYQAQLIGTDGNTATVRTCTLPPGNLPTLESWPEKAAAVRVADFKPAKGGRC